MEKELAFCWTSSFISFDGEVKKTILGKNGFFMIAVNSFPLFFVFVVNNRRGSVNMILIPSIFEISAN
jgi:hypothetical protein